MRKIVLVLFLFLAFSCDLFAQSVSLSLAGAMAAHGGAAVTSIHTIRIAAHQTVQKSTEVVQISGNIVDGAIRVDYGQPITRSQITPGVGSGVTPFEYVNGKRRDKQGFVGLFGQLDILSGLGIAQFLAPLGQVQELGAASINGRAVARLQVGSGRKQTHYFRELSDTAEVDIDAATGLVAAISRKFSAEQNLDHTFERTFVFSDYRNVNGVVFPFQIDTKTDGTLRQSLIVDSVEFNPAFTADLFRN